MKVRVTSYNVQLDIRTKSHSTYIKIIIIVIIYLFTKVYNDKTLQ